eukprot:717208-Pleurochrysis_carterae.AAC.5
MACLRACVRPCSYLRLFTVFCFVCVHESARARKRAYLHRRTCGLRVDVCACAYLRECVRARVRAQELLH